MGGVGAPHEALGDHAADADGAAGDEGHLALEAVEELGDAQLVVVVPAPERQRAPQQRSGSGVGWGGDSEGARVELADGRGVGGHVGLHGRDELGETALGGHCGAG